MSLPHALPVIYHFFIQISSIVKEISEVWKLDFQITKQIIEAFRLCVLTGFKFAIQCFELVCCVKLCWREWQSKYLKKISFCTRGTRRKKKKREKKIEKFSQFIIRSWKTGQFNVIRRTWFLRAQFHRQRLQSAIEMEFIHKRKMKIKLKVRKLNNKHEIFLFLINCYFHFCWRETIEIW